MNRTLLLLIALAACEAQDFPTDVDCPAGDEHIDGVVLPQDQAAVQTTDLRVIGQARHVDGLAIRTVEALGVIATNTGFNHDAWEMSLPISSLVDAARRVLPSGADPNEAIVAVTVTVEATDACGRREPVGSFDVDVDLSPASRLDVIELVAQLPGVADHLPSDGSAEATLLVTANPSAVGTAVTLEASRGTFRGVNGDNQVQLSGDGVADAGATVFYAFDAGPYDGDVLLTVSGAGVVGTTTVAIAGPPRLTPATLTLSPGDSQTVTILTDGALELCYATGADVGDLAVEAGSVSLLEGPLAESLLGDGVYPSFTVALPDDAAEPGAVTVTCEDVFGQRGTGEYAGVL
jgi:hypothetical protein